MEKSGKKITINGTLYITMWLMDAMIVLRYLQSAFSGGEYVILSRVWIELLH
jgi:hypothetical protein